MRRTVILLTLVALVLAGCGHANQGSNAAKPERLRLGYFANLTHAQAVVGVAEGNFAKATGLTIETRVFAAGPEGITALLAGEIDMLYVGPSPAVSGYMNSGGAALRVVAGVTSGGAVFVVRPGFDATHLDSARIGTPGLANTQDVALRWYLHGKGLKPKEQGGTVAITPAAPADIMNLFGRGQLDAAWLPEPWGARLVAESGAKIAWDERDLWPDRKFATAVLVASTSFLRDHRALALKFVREHVALTKWMQANPAEACKKLQAALQNLSAHALPDQVIADAYSRMDVVYDPMEASVQAQADHAYQLGLLKQKPDLSGLYDRSLLREVAP